MWLHHLLLASSYQSALSDIFQDLFGPQWQPDRCLGAKVRQFDKSHRGRNFRSSIKIPTSELQYLAMDPTHEWSQMQMPGFNVPLNAAPAVSFIPPHTI